MSEGLVVVLSILTFGPLPAERHTSLPNARFERQRGGLDVMGLTMTMFKADFCSGRDIVVLGTTMLRRRDGIETCPGRE